MIKREAELTTKLMKNLDQIFSGRADLIWVEVKVVKRPRRFSTRLLSDKAKLMLQYTKFKHKFSDAERTGTPLDFIYSNNVTPYLCVIFWEPYQKNTAYFLKYSGGDFILNESDLSLKSEIVYSFN